MHRLTAWSRGAVVCSLLLLSTQSALADDVTIIIQETQQQKAEREFRERQQRIAPATSAADQAQREYEERQRRLLCAAHPEQCH